MHYGQTLQSLFIETALDLLLLICLAVSIMQTSLEKTQFSFALIWMSSTMSSATDGSLNSFYVFYPIRARTRDSFNQSGAREFFNQSGAKTELNATVSFPAL